MEAGFHRTSDELGSTISLQVTAAWVRTETLACCFSESSSVSAEDDSGVIT